MYAAAACATRPVVLVVATDRDVEETVADARFFLAAMEGLSSTETERVVLPFPSQEVDPYRGLLPHFDVASARARALHALAAGHARLVVASAAALLPTLSPPERFAEMSVELALGHDIAPPDLRALLARAGFVPEDPVDEHGEYCVRGGVVDFFPAGDAYPVRLEFIGDTIESIRRFDPATQRSVATLDRVAVIPLRELAADESPGGVAGPRPPRDVLRLLPAAPGPGSRSRKRPPSTSTASGWTRRCGPASSRRPGAERRRCRRQRRWCSAGSTCKSTSPAPCGWSSWASRSPRPRAGIATSPGPRHATSPASRRSSSAAASRTGSRRSGAPGSGATPSSSSSAPAGGRNGPSSCFASTDLLAVSIERAETTRGMAVLVAHGRLSRGFRLPDAGLVLFAEADVFDEDRQRQDRRKSATGAFLSDFRDLKKGDHVVHVDHGIGVFVGLKTLSVGSESQEFMELRYAGEDKCFVPVERLDLVQRYSGVAKPPLDRLGGTSWEKTKTRVKKAMRDMADELLKLYAARKAVKGHAFPPDTHWQEEFEGAFEYDLTPDQRSAIADIKKDMEAGEPMDRLLCGDVGYGKTEVAMRAAFKAVMDGKQVAVLAPDHGARLPAPEDVRPALRRVPGPHRHDQPLPDQGGAEGHGRRRRPWARWTSSSAPTGCCRRTCSSTTWACWSSTRSSASASSHKERIKQMRKRVDVLTLTATPIPRTLNMSLVGIRDMSVIETPPRDRLSIQTNVVKFDQRVLASAIENELERGGQVYFVHNRVESIDSMGEPAAPPRAARRGSASATGR